MSPATCANLSIDVGVIGLIGNDRSGQQLRDLFANAKDRHRRRGRRQDFHTIVKTRIIARNQQVVRVDREQDRQPIARTSRQVVAAVRKNLQDIDAIIFEDYGKGFLTSDLVSQIARDVSAAGKIIAADPNARNLIDWKGHDRGETEPGGSVSGGGNSMARSRRIRR